MKVSPKQTSETGASITTWKIKSLIVAGSTIAYCAVFLYAYPSAGPGIAAIGVLPVTIAGLLFNRSVGITAGLLLFVLNTLLFNLVGQSGLLTVVSYGGAAGQFVAVLIGAVTGWISELRRRQQQLLAEQRQLAAELSEERDFLNSIMQTSVAAILVLNEEGEIVYANDRAEDVMGLAHEEITGRRYNSQSWNVTDPQGNHVPDEKLPFVQVMATGKPVSNVQLAIQQANGERKVLSVNAAPLTDDDGEIKRVVCSVADITQQWKIQATLQENERRFRALVQNSTDLIVVLDKDGIVTYASASAQHIVGYTPEELVGRHGFAHIHPDDLPTAKATLSALIQKPRRIQKMEMRFKHKDGTWRILQATGRNLLDHPAVSGIVTNSRDITDRKEMERALRRRAEEAETLREAGAAVAATLHQEKALARILEQVERVVPYDTASVMLLRDDYLEIVDGRGFPDAEAVIGLQFPVAGDNPVRIVVETCRPYRLPNAPAEYEIFNRPPHTHIRSWLGVPLITSDELIGMLTLDSTEYDFFTAEHVRLASAFANQVAIAIENAQLYARMQELARTDGLTGIYNRRAFFEHGRREVERAQRVGCPLTVLMIDIDHFKHVNDTYGHAVGDEVLAEIARRCDQQLRAVDIFGRFGGEEFVVLLSEADTKEARLVAERLRTLISAPVQTDAGVVSVTASMGIAPLDETNADLDMLLHHADLALYRAKEAGRDCVAVCETEFR